MNTHARRRTLDTRDWIVIAIALLLMGCLLWAGTVYFRAHMARAAVTRVRADMRSLAVAIEGYLVDCMRYPAFAVGNKSVNGVLVHDVQASRMPSFCLPEPLPPGAAPQQSWIPEHIQYNLKLMTLTTPFAYMERYPLDPFAPASKATYVYWSVCWGQTDPSGKTVGKDSPTTGGMGWILLSPGPDGDYDLAGEWDAYNPSVRQPSPQLLAGTNRKGSAFTYDPTNGTVSDGDIWRVKQ